MKSAKQFEVMQRLLSGFQYNPNKTVKRDAQGNPVRRPGRLTQERNAAGHLQWWVVSPEGRKVLRVREKVLAMFRVEWGWAV